MTTDTPQMDLPAALALRRDHLLRTQNADGGWGYFPGKESWLEPTVYAALALQGEPASQKALALLATWQRADGAWRAGAKVPDAHWATALMLVLYRAMNRQDTAYTKGLDWLSKVAGTEGSLPVRMMQYFLGNPADQDETIHGWPWRPGNSSWVEPTAHALVALKQSGRANAYADRIAEGEGYLFNRRCPDGGWNYGNKRVFNTNLTSYPETTALAILGLQGRKLAELKPSFDRAILQMKSARSGLAKAWLTIALRAHGVSFEPPPLGALAPGGDLAVTGLELLAHDKAGTAFRVEKQPS